MRRDETRELLAGIGAYVEGLFAPPDPVLDGVLRRSHEAGLPEIHVSPSSGKLLQLLVGISRARRILEIGTLGGYSTIHLARALPEDGCLISLELDERHAEVARGNIARAGLAEKVEVRVGDARRLLAAMADEPVEPFDLAFIDADKGGYPEYLEWAIRLSRPGSVILADNTIRSGAVLDPKDDLARATSEFNEGLARDPRLEATILPVLRPRIDGVAIARVVGG